MRNCAYDENVASHPQWPLKTARLGIFPMKCYVFALYLSLAVGAAALAYSAPFDVLEQKPAETDTPPAEERAATAQEIRPPQATNPAPTAPAKEPKSPVPTVGDEVTLAAEALARGDRAACEEQLRAAYVKSPSLPPLRLMLAELMLAMDKVTDAQQVLEEYAAIDRTHPDLYFLFGATALRQRRWTDASMHFEKALTLPSPANWSPDQALRRKCQCYGGQVEIAEQRQDWAEMRRVLTQWLEVQRNDPELHTRMAQAYFHDGRSDNAFDYFDLAFRLNNQLPRPEVAMGAISAKAKRFDQAERWFERAHTQLGDDPALHFEWSCALLAQGRAAEAKTHAETAAARGLKSTPLALHQAVLARLLGQPQEAEKQLRGVLRSAPRNREARHQLALILAEQEGAAKQREALQIARELEREQPQSPWTLTVLGVVLYRAGERQEAEEKLLEAIVRGAVWPETIYFTARVLHDGGKADETRQVAHKLREVLALGVLFPQRDEARAWLDAALRETAVVQPALVQP